MNALFDRIDDEDLDGVREVLRDQPELATVSEDDATPLFWACQLDYPRIALALLEAGADPDQHSGDGEVPLHVAAFEGSEECVRILLQRGANVNARTDEGKTSLMNAAQGGFARIVAILLEQGADVKAKDEVGRTALHWTMVGEHDDAAIPRILLSAGLEAEDKNDNGDTALDYARAMKKSALARELTAR